MEIDFDTLLDYVYDDLPKEQYVRVAEWIDQDSVYQAIVQELLLLKAEFGEKEKVKRFLKEKKDRVRNNLFPKDK